MFRSSSRILFVLLMSQAVINSVCHGREPSLEIRPFVRLPNIPVSEFEEKYAPRDVAVPVVFEGLMDDVFDPAQWTRQSFRNECGHINILDVDADKECKEPGASKNEDCHSVRFINPRLIGKKWGGMDTADVDQLHIKTVADLFDRQESSSGSGLVLFDAPLSHYCPQAMDRLRVPKYFPTDYNIFDTQGNLLDSANEDNQWPSIIISMKGVGTPLHADSGMTRFWNHLLSGRKLWRAFPPTEYHKLYATNGIGTDNNASFYPTIFEADALNPDFNKFPLLDGAIVYETILNPGEVLFLPEGWAHQVVNLEDTIMTSYNFVDNHALDMAYKSRKHRNDGEDDDYTILWNSFFMPLDGPSQMGVEENLTFKEFFRNHFLSIVPVPSVVKKWVKEGGSEAIDSEWNHEGLPALHVATSFNFFSVVEYLLEEGGADVNAKSRDGYTALDYAEASGFSNLRDLLLRHGGQSRLSHNS